MIKLINPEEEQSKKVEFLQDSKYVITTYKEKVHRQIYSILPTVKENNSLMRVEEGSPSFPEG